MFLKSTFYDPFIILSIVSAIPQAAKATVTPIMEYIKALLALLIFSGLPAEIKNKMPAHKNAITDNDATIPLMVFITLFNNVTNPPSPVFKGSGIATFPVANATKPIIKPDTMSKLIKDFFMLYSLYHKFGIQAVDNSY